MSLALGNQWVGEVRQSGGRVVRYDTMRVDSVLRSDTIDWYRLQQHDGTAAPRPDWLGDSWLAVREDGLYTPMIQSAGFPGMMIHRRMRYPVSIGDTAIDFGWFRYTSKQGSAEGRSREIGIVTSIDEQIDVPAGRFTAYHVEVTRISEPSAPSPGSAMYSHLWFSPGPGLIRAESHNSSGSIDQIWELSGWESRVDGATVE